MDCSMPGSSVHGILQARILGWVAMSFSRGFSWPRDQTWVSCFAGRHFTMWTTREALTPEKVGVEYFQIKKKNVIFQMGEKRLGSTIGLKTSTSGTPVLSEYAPHQLTSYSINTCKMNAPRLYSSARKCLLMSFLGFFALQVPINEQTGKMCNYNKMTVSSTSKNTDCKFSGLVTKIQPLSLYFWKLSSW